MKTRTHPTNTVSKFALNIGPIPQVQPISIALPCPRKEEGLLIPVLTLEAFNSHLLLGNPEGGNNDWGWGLLVLRSTWTT